MRTITISLGAMLSVLWCTAPGAAGASFIGPMHVIKAHASTVPQNGDVNPYGVAVVPRSMGLLRQDHILVSNFNNAGNLQGTGTTIVQVSASRNCSGKSTRVRFQEHALAEWA